jgi:hypothetical protein
LGFSLSGEAVVLEALRARLIRPADHGTRRAFQELWVPRSHERVDLAVIGQRMDGFEIKSERDTLRRLPRQVVAYSRVMDRCTLVVAEKHVESAQALVPDWWGLSTVACNGHVRFRAVRGARMNPAVDPEILVRLLWREEALAALKSLGADPDPKSHRSSLWRELLDRCSVRQLRSAVRSALLGRDPARVRPPASRLSSAADVGAARL